MSFFKKKKDEPSEIVLTKEQFFDDISKKFNIEIKPSVVDSKIEFNMHRCINRKNMYVRRLVDNPFTSKIGESYGETLQFLRLNQDEYTRLISLYKSICDEMYDFMKLCNNTQNINQ